MNEKNLAEKIRKMAEICDTETIARALNLPEEVVKGVIEGSISDDILESYNPAKPPEIKIIEKKQFFRSRFIGVISVGEANADILVSTIGVLSALNGVKTGIFDLKEFPRTPFYLNFSLSNPFVNFPWNEEFREHPQVKNLTVMMPAPNLSEYENLKLKDIEDLIYSFSGSSEIIFINLPDSLLYLQDILPLFDIIFAVNSQDYISLRHLQSLFYFSVSKGIDKKVHLINIKDQNSIEDYEFQKGLKKFAEWEIIGRWTPERKFNADDLIKYLENHKEKVYAEGLKSVLSFLNIKIKEEEKTSFLKRILK